MRDMHPKWKKQVREIVGELHAVGIIWGDVNLGNIIVDYELNAWVIDFGSGFIDEFVDKDLAGTKEGDLEGIDRIFQDWILSDDM